MTMENLKRSVGVWRAQVDVFAGPAPSSSTGTMTSRLACVDTWLVSDYVGDSGQFCGHGMWTFDKTKGKYTGVWADNMMQFVAPGEGTWDEASRTMTYLYEATVGERHVKWRQTHRFSADGNVIEFASFVPDTATSPMMTIKYTRQS